MQSSCNRSDTDDDELPVPKNIFMSERTVQNLHSRGWYETDDQSVDANDSRVLQINDTVFKMDDMLNKSDTQYEAFLLEVERANDEFFKSKGQSVNKYRQPAVGGNHLGRAAAAANVEFEYSAYDNGDYYDVDTLDEEQAIHGCFMANGDEGGVEMDEEYDGGEELDDEDDEENDGDEMDASEELPLVKVQKVSAGYILNSNVYLTLPQWHTLLVAPDINQTYCVLCDTYIDLNTDAEHIEDPEHLDSFNLYKPLKRFELSITRLIRTRYHCGVCNALFDDQDDINHLDTEQHGENMLFAINKASDLVYAYNLDRSRDDTLDQRNVTPDKRQDTMTYPFNTPTSSMMSYSACFTKPARATSVESYQDDTPDRQNYESDTYDPAVDTQTPGISYAAMAKKTKMDDLPDLLKIDLGDKLVTVKFDSWHMIISTGLNKLYCMACQTTDHKRVKADHCRSSTHLEKLMKCSVVEVYETHLIRKVGEKLYHCGHCNNLQPIDLMEEHVEQYHPRNARASVAKTADTHQSVAASPTRSANQAHSLENQQLDRPGPSQDWTRNRSWVQQFVGANLVKYDNNGSKLANHETLGTTQALNHQSHGFFQQFVGANPSAASPTRNLNQARSLDSPHHESHQSNSSSSNPIHENDTAGATQDLPTNLQRLKASGLSKTMEFTDNIGDNDIPTSTNSMSQTNLAVTQNNSDAPKSIQPAIDPIDHFESIWQERKPKTEPESKADAKEIDPPTQTSDTQNSTDSKKLVEASGTLEAKLTPPSVPSPKHVNAANKNIKVFQFKPDFVKTVHMFGYILSVHILSLNAIIKLQYFYRCAFCDENVEEAMLLEHMLDYRHVALLPTAPYMPEFSLHLIRRIRMFVHCGICNLVLPNEHFVVLNHNASPTHSFLLKRALGFEAHTAAANPVLPLTLSPPPNTPFLVPPVQNPAPSAPNGVAPTSPDNVAKSETSDSKSAKKASKANVAEEILVDFTEEFYLIKQRKQLIKVNRNALNTIVFCGDGTLFCFVCETNIGAGDPMEHIGDKGHRKCLTESKMLNNYGNSLLRQLDNMYHCATCNVIIQKKYLQRHLSWYKHLKYTDDANCNSGNDRLDENQGEIPKIDIPTQKERLNAKDRGKFVIHFSFVIARKHCNKDSNDNIIHDDGEASETVAVQRMNKIIIVKDEVFKIKWEHWHGLATYKDGFKCKICSSDFDEEAWRDHVQEARHLAGLGKPLVEDLPRDLLRQLTDSKLHCLICNVELSTSDNICEHLDGKKHNKNRDLIVEESAKVNAYSDCEREVWFV